MVLELSALLVQRPPDILVDDRGKLFALKSEGGSLLLLSNRVSKFVAKTWLRRVGYNSSDSDKFPKSGYGKDGRLAYDQLGCVLKSKAGAIGMITNSQALSEDCRHLDVIISSVPVTWNCPSAKLIIDRFDLYRNGGHAFWINDDSVSMLSAKQVRGRRPRVLRWVLRPKSRRDR